MLLIFAIAYIVIAFALLAVMRHANDEDGAYGFGSDAAVALLWLPFLFWVMGVVWSDAHRRRAAN